MFPFPHHHHHLPSSSSSSSAYNISNNPQENNEHNIYLYHHHHHHHHPHPNNLNPFTIPFLSPNNLNHPQISHQPAELNIASTSANPINIPYHHHHFDPAAPASFLLPTTKRSPAAAPVKKDRHSKIYTAQGLRDRRVRLSIEISRKFFDLQDMLGFDKASKTLDWLLTKSKKAIKELAQNGCAKSSTNFSSPSSNYNNNCGDDEEEDDDDQENVDDEVDGRLLGTVPSHYELKKMKKLQKSGSTVNDLVAKESRAKARERARERTRMKMCTRSRSSGPNPNPNPNHHHHQHALRIFGQEGNNENGSRGKNVADEPTVSKRKMKPSATTTTTTTMGGPSASNNCLSNLVQNWDINSSFARSSFCASSNMNLSTELQLYGNLWEATEDNHCQQ